MIWYRSRQSVQVTKICFQLFLAVAIPLDLPRNSAYLAFNWEANYRLPNNISDFNYPPIIEKRIDRKLIYNALEYKLKTYVVFNKYFLFYFQKNLIINTMKLCF